MATGSIQQLHNEMAHNLTKAMELKLEKTYIAQQTPQQPKRADDAKDEPTATDKNVWQHASLTVCGSKSTTVFALVTIYPHMPIGKVWICRLMIVRSFICTVIFVILYGYRFLRPG